MCANGLKDRCWYQVSLTFDGGGKRCISSEGVLTLGFARRFVPYKRPDLVVV